VVNDMTDNPTPETLVTNCDALRTRLYTLNRIDKLPWREIAKKPDFVGIPAGTLCRISKGYEPKNNHIRSRLGLPAMVSTPVCPTCGKVHISKICPMTRKNAPRVKHICENCTWWKVNDYLGNVGNCNNETMLEHTNIGFTYGDFGCRFWKRKEAQS
jgi:predicted RNA-binding Zn-ribbon protein involved in translation (DUF1610 family)